MKRSLKQVNRWRKRQGYSQFSTFVNAFHLVRLSVLMNIKAYVLKHKLSSEHSRP